MTFTFLPWMRNGLAGSIATQDDDTKATNRATLAAGITLNTGAGNQPPSQTVHLYGPGDVLGMEPSYVVRTDPPDGSTSHEPTRFVLAELADPDGAWALTPTTATGGQRIRPWMTLVVVRQQDGVVLGPGIEPAIEHASDRVAGDTKRRTSGSNHTVGVGAYAGRRGDRVDPGPTDGAGAAGYGDLAVDMRPAARTRYAISGLHRSELPRRRAGRPGPNGRPNFCADAGVEPH